MEGYQCHKQCSVLQSKEDSTLKKYTISKDTFLNKLLF
jgi:hypothetical protein